MNESDESPDVQMVSKHFDALISRESQAWDECFPILLKFAEYGINNVKRSNELEASEKKELQDIAIYKLNARLAKPEINKPGNASHLLNFLKRVAENTTKDLFKSSARKYVGPIQPHEEEEKAENPQKITDTLKVSITPADKLKNSEKCAQVYEALGQIGESCKNILIQFYEEDLSYAEIANITGIGIQKVTQKIRKCKNMLKVLFYKTEDQEFELKPLDL